jgi:Saxitoxin biosynthesis operon protein SxtJ
MMQPSITPKQLRSFGLTVGGIFAVIGAWPVVFRGSYPRLWALALAALLILPALLFPRSLKPLYRGWMALGEALGWINTRIILGLVFYGLITPMGVTMRFLMGKDPMHRGFDPNASTYRVLRQPRPGSHMRRQY